MSSAQGSKRQTPQPQEGGVFSHFLRNVTLAGAQRPAMMLGFVAFLTLLSIGVTGRFLTFKTNRADLIDPSQDFHKRWKEFIQTFGDDSDIVVVVEGTNTEAIRPALDYIGQKLSAEKDLFSRVLYQIDPSSLRNKALQYLTPVELEAAHERLEMYGPVLQGHWNRAGLESYTRRLADHIQLSGAKNSQADLNSLLSQTQLLVTSLSDFLQNPQAFTNPWPEVISSSTIPHGNVSETQYQLTPNGKMGFVLALPKNVSTDFSGTSSSIARMNQVLDEARAEFRELKIGATGIPVLEADEMRRSQSDMAAASIISFLGVLMISLVGFRGVRHPFMSMSMIAIGIAWAMGYTTIVIGHLNILSVSFATILIGVGDYGTHYIASYLENRHKGLSLMDALAETSSVVGPGIVTAAITTSLSFFAAAFTTFLGVAELGLIAGGGILLCAVATFAVLPPLIALADRKLEPRQLPVPFQGHMLRLVLKKFPGTVAIFGSVAVICMTVSIFTIENGQIAFRIKYDYNLLNMQAKGLESVELQERIFKEANGSLLYSVTMTDSAEKVRLLKEQFLELPTVARVEDLAVYMPAYSPAETNLLVQAIHARLRNLTELPRGLPQIDPSSIGGALENLMEVVRQRPEPVAQMLSMQLDGILDGMDSLPLEYQVNLMAGYQQGMLMALHRQFQAIAEISNSDPVTPYDFPDELRSRFVSDGGMWLLRVYPIEEIWDEEPLTNFVTDIRKVDPNATGTPIQNFEAAHQIQTSYANAAIYAAGVIIVVLLMDVLGSGALLASLCAPLAVVGVYGLLMDRAGEAINPVVVVSIYLTIAMACALIIDFSKAKTALLALMPPLCGLLLMFGILSLMGVDVNPANLIVLPLIMGIGMDSGVYVIHDFRHQSGKYQISRSTVNAVTITSLTTAVGFGSMMVAAHQGLVSLGMVLTIGVGCCLFVSLVLLPAILTIITRNREDVIPQEQNPPDEAPSRNLKFREPRQMPLFEHLPPRVDAA